jgi:hypothetical protein
VQEAGTVTERLLPRDDDITASHDITRSGRRGYVTHATNVGITDADIKRLARWRAIEAATGRHNRGILGDQSDDQIPTQNLSAAVKRPPCCSVGWWSLNQQW